MKIKTIKKPLFKHKGIEYDVESRMFISLSEFENYITRKNPEYVYIYKITNIDDNNKLIHPCNGLNDIREDINIMFIYFKMIK